MIIGAECLHADRYPEIAGKLVKQQQKLKTFNPSPS